MERKAIVVGSGGQDGQILTSQLRQLGYQATRCVRPGTVHPADSGQSTIDISAPDDVAELINSFRPQEIYFLAAYHHSAEESSGDFARHLARSYEIHVAALTNFLEGIRRSSPSTRLFYAASSHIFGPSPPPPQDELTPINPISAYGISKAAGVFACRHYRTTHKIFASVGILYNHESELRSGKFLSRKIVDGVADIAHGRASGLTLGNLDAIVDWGYAPDYTEAMRRILQAESPDDFVIASGVPHAVRDFARIAFETVGLDYQQYVRSDPAIINRNPGILIGNPGRLMRATGWRPSVDFATMVRRLVMQQMLPADRPAGPTLDTPSKADR
jgi:GDPmannose 4,6-dehydratase